MDEILQKVSEVNGALRTDSALFKTLELTPNGVDPAVFEPGREANCPSHHNS